MYTRQQIESALPKMTPEDREQTLKMLEHSCSFYDPIGNHISHDYEKENLLKVIGERDAYAIDNNSTWKQECLLPENRNKAFIISPPLAREDDNTKSLILDKVRCKLGNIFSVGIISSEGGSTFRILVDRIDEPYKYAFDMPKLSEASKGKGATVAKQQLEIWDIIANEKRRLNKILYFEKACDIPPPTDSIVRGYIQAFKQSIPLLAPECRYNMDKTKKLTYLCYLLLLMEDTQPKKGEGPRAEYDMTNYPFVFGDMYVLQTAIYLRCNILTRDGPLTQMASYAGISCYHVPRSTPPRC